MMDKTTDKEEENEGGGNVERVMRELERTLATQQALTSGWEGIIRDAANTQVIQQSVLSDWERAINSASFPQANLSKIVSDFGSLIGPLIQSRLTQKSLHELSEKVESTGSGASETIDAIAYRLGNIEKAIDDSPAKEEIVKLKDDFTNLNSQFAEMSSQTSSLIGMIQENSDFLVSASLAKTIPVILQRIDTLEKADERRRAWSFNYWSLVLAALGIIFTVLSCMFGGLIAKVFLS